MEQKKNNSSQQEVNKIIVSAQTIDLDGKKELTGTTQNK